MPWKGSRPLYPSQLRCSYSFFQLSRRAKATASHTDVRDASMLAGMSAEHPISP